MKSSNTCHMRKNPDAFFTVVVTALPVMKIY